MAGRPIKRYAILAGGIALMGLFGWAVYLVINPVPNDAVPALYHREDGTFSLNRKDGPAVTPSDMAAYYSRYDSDSNRGGIRLIANATTQLTDWNPFLEVLAEENICRFQLEAGNKKFIYHPPLCMPEEDYVTDPEIIYLDASAPAAGKNCPNYHFQIVVNDKMKCEKAIDLASQKADQGLAVVVYSHNVYMMHDPKLDAVISPPAPPSLPWVRLYRKFHPIP